MATALILQAGFTNVNRQAQKCAQPADKTVVWSDGTRLWYRDAFFATLVIGSLLYGLAGLMPGSLLCFDPDQLLFAKGTWGEALCRCLAVLPTIGFVYYFVWIVVKKNSLIKPVRSSLFPWERPLAVLFSLVFIPTLLYAVFGLQGGGQLLKTLFSFRPLCLILLAAVFYVFVWRLQGGLFATKKQADELRQRWAS